VTTRDHALELPHLSEIAKLAHALGATAYHLAIAEPSGARAAARDPRRAPLELAMPHVARAVADARRSACRPRRYVATPPDAKDRFAGIGVTEPPAAEPTAARPPPERRR